MKCRNCNHELTELRSFSMPAPRFKCGCCGRIYASAPEPCSRLDQAQADYDAAADRYSDAIDELCRAQAAHAKAYKKLTELRGE